jgi:class 3 adenylate cyclase
LNPNSPFPPAYQVSVYSLAGAIRTQEELRWQILAFSLVALAGALVLSLVISHGLSVPLRQLAAATTAVRSGDLQVRVPVRSRDDLGQLAESFNEMAEGLGQKERYRTVLNMVADEEVAKALVEGQLALGGELREISVLFCDIRGFTPYTENMPPKDVIDMLNEHMTALTRVVKEHNGVLDKFVGDLLMAIFGAPISHETDTLNAARCALALVREREALNATSRHKLKVGIGIATGRAVAGCMGSFDRLNYTVLGERVNLASRLCSQAGPGQIVIDQSTREKLGDTITATPLPALNLKGFTENVAAYELKEIRLTDTEAQRKIA